MEYLGYVSNRDNTVDWAGITSGLSGAIQEVGAKQQARRDENERLKQESDKLINSTEQSKSQTLNEFVLKGADQGRSKLVEWNKDLKAGKISGRDYKQRIANLNEYWGSLSTTAKNFDTRLTEAMKRQQVGEDGTLPPASEIEAEMQAHFGGLSQLSDKSIVIGDDGRVVVGKYDADGNLLSTEDVKYINNPANMQFNRTDLSGMVNADVKNWGEWTNGRVSDVRNNPQFGVSKTRLVNTLTADPRSAASVLVDNTDGEYAVYFNEEDKQRKIAQMRELYEAGRNKISDEDIARKLILMQQDVNGDYQPNLTKGQLDKAKELVGSEIEIQLSRKVESAPVYRGDNGPSYDQQKRYAEEEEDNLRGYMAVRAMFEKQDPSGLKKGYTYEAKRDRQGNFIVEVRGAEKERKVPVMRDGKEVPGKYTIKYDRPLIKTVTTPDGLAEFAFDRNDQNTAIRRFNTGRDQYNYRGMSPQPQAGGGTKSQNISESDFNKKWATLKKGQKLVGPDGITYTKK